MVNLEQVELKTLVQCIGERKYKELKGFFENNEVNRNKIDILLVRSIESNSDIEIIDYLISQRKNNDINFKVIDNRKKVPLYSAIEHYNFKLADILIQKYKADITYEMNNMINYLLTNNDLTCKQLKYIYSKLDSKKRDCNIDLFLLIKSRKNKILELVCSGKRYDIDYIKKLLFMYKSCKDNNSLNNIKSQYQKFDSLIKNNKKQFLPTEEMYQIAIDNKNFEALRILSQNDGNEENVLLNRNLKFDLLEKAVSLDNYKWVKSILNYDIFNYKSFKHEYIFTLAINNRNHNIIEILYKNFIYYSTFPRKNYTKDKNVLNNNYDPRFINRVLNIIIKYGYLELVKNLIECEEYKHCIDLNVKDINGQYPIIFAVDKGDHEIFQYLIDQGANVNVKTKNNIPLLLKAIKKNNVEIVKEIFNQSYVNIKEKDLNGFDAYTEAMIRGNFKIVELILNFAKDHRISIPINQKDSKGSYPLMQAINQDNFNLVVSLIQYGNELEIDMDIEDKDYTPLILSYNKGYMEIFKYLIRNLNINEIDSSGNNLLYYAIEKNDVEMVQSLIYSGIDTNIKNNKGVSIFDHAIENRNVEILKVLLENDCILLDEEDSQGDTPLFKILKTNKLSYQNDRKVLAESIVKNGANINITDAEGNYPLTLAIKKNYSSLVKIFVDNGAMNFEDENGKTPMDYGLEDSSTQIRKCLYDNGFKNFNATAPKNDSLKSIVGNNEISILKLLLDKNLDINQKISKYNTTYSILGYAIYEGKPEMVEYLLKHGANKNTLDDKGSLYIDIIDKIHRRMTDGYRLGSFEYTETGKKIKEIFSRYR